MLINQRHPIHDLIQEELRTKSASLHPNLEPAEVRYALAAAGAGLDHTVAEQALVLVDDSAKRGMLEDFSLVTDRRLVGRWTERAAACFGVRFRDARSYQAKKGVLGSKIHVTMATQDRGASVETVQTGTTFDALGRFFSRLLTVGPAEREPVARPLSYPSADDPTGAALAAREVGDTDEHSAMLLRAIGAAHERRLMPANVAVDFVARVVLHHRNVHYGRGMHGGRLMSPVGTNDLSNVLVGLYGNPVAHAEEPVRTLEFDTRLRSETGRALASSVVGLASAAILGVGWTSRAERRVSCMRVMLADTGSFASFRLQERSGRSLHLAEPGLVNEVDVQLLAEESDILTRRIALGWELATPELSNVDAGQIERRFADLVGRPSSNAPTLLHEVASPLLSGGRVDLDREGELIVSYPHGSFDETRERYLSRLAGTGWTMVPSSETDATSVAAVLRGIGQHDAAALAERKTVYGATFERDQRLVCLTVDSDRKGAGLQVQLSCGIE